VTGLEVCRDGGGKRSICVRGLKPKEEGPKRSKEIASVSQSVGEIYQGRSVTREKGDKTGGGIRKPNGCDRETPLGINVSMQRRL